RGAGVPARHATSSRHRDARYFKVDCAMTSDSPRFTISRDAGNAAPLGREQIAASIPHSGAMCLLDEVQAWDDTRIRCVATSHRDPHNPLRARGRLATICGIEYAAQAMAKQDRKSTRLNS